jgi:hypothetical protein
VGEEAVAEVRKIEKERGKREKGRKRRIGEKNGIARIRRLWRSGQPVGRGRWP